MLFLHRFLTGPSLTLPEFKTLVRRCLQLQLKLTGLININIEKNLNLQKSVLPAIGPVDAESKISSATVVQPVIAGPGAQSSQPTYAKVVKTSQQSAATGMFSNTGSTGLTSDLSAFTSTGVLD